MAFIDDIVKFHSFSKSTVRTGLTLGEAVNPSGHTVTSKQVRSDDIPWFVNSFQGDEAKARTWAAANATAARHNDILYYGAEFKVGFTAPKCLIYVSKHEVDGKLVDLPAEQCGWQTFDLNAATTLKNADGKDVIAIHKNAKVEYVDGNNNAATNSNQQSLFVRRADGTLLDHFVAATDQIVGGQPSLGYSAVVSVGGKAIDEGEGTGNYIGNTYAGIVHFHAARTEGKETDGSVKNITVTCFEYIGDKLDTTIGNIREEIQDIVGVTMEGVVASVGTNDAATSAGIGVDSTSKTSPKITFTAGSVTTGETKLVTGGAVAAVTDALSGRVSTTEGQIATITSTDVTKEGSIAKALADAKTYAEGQASAAKSGAETTAANALSAARTEITAEIAAAKEQAIAGSTVKITASTAEGKTGIEITPNGGPSNAFTVGIDQSIIATVASVTAISNIITDNKEEIDGKISTINGILDGLTKGDDSIYAKIDSKVASVKLGSTIPTGISLGDDAKNPVLTIETLPQSATNAEYSTHLITAGGAHALATHYASVAEGAAVNTVKAISLGSLASSTQGSYVSVTTSGTIGNGLSVSVDDSALASTVSAAASAVQSVTVNGTEAKSGTSVAITALTGVHATDNGNSGITIHETEDKKVTLSIIPATYSSSTKSWTNETYVATASDITLAISDAVNGITIPDINLSGAAREAGFSLGNDDKHYLNLATAAYTAANETGKIGTWTEATKGYLVTGANVAAAISDVNAKVDALHQTPQFKVEVVTGVTDLTKWEESVTDGIKENYIYLVANTEAADGSYIEYIAYKNGETIVTERIGTTKTDLSGYVKTVTINGQSYTATANNAGTINIGKAASSMATGQATTLANQGSVYGHIAENGTLTLGVASATASVMGVSKMFSADLSTAASTVTDTAVSVKSAQAMYSTLAGLVGSLSDSKIDSVQGTNYLKLAGLAVNTNDNDVTISTIGIYGSDCLPPTTVKVENGMVYASNGWSMPLNTNAIANGEEFLQGRTTFTSWVSDLSNMTKGISMFKNCTSLTTFVGDLSSLVSADDMFYGCTLDAESLEILADTLPRVTSGTIDFGASTNATADVIATIKAKGWTLKSNGAVL